MAYGQVNADVIGTSVSGSNLGAGNASIMKNRLINGSMTIDQRNAGASVTGIAGAVYGVDRWQVQCSQASKLTMQQNAGSVTQPAGFTNYVGITSSSAYTVGASESFYLNQKIEGLNIGDLGWGTADAKTVTLSFWVRSSLTGTFGVALWNSAANRVYPVSYTISSANTWEQKSITIAGDTSGTWLTTNGIGINVNFGLGFGSTISGTGGTWNAGTAFMPTGATSVVGTSGATFYITGVQLEVGSSATGYEYRQYGQELALCQRYAFLAAVNDQLVGFATYYSSTRVDIIVFFPTTMRTTPSLTAASGSNYYAVYRAGASDNINSLTLNEFGVNACTVMNNTEASGTAGDSGWLYSGGSGRVLFSAEL